MARAGQYKYPITILNAVSVKDEYGHNKRTYSDICKTRCAVHFHSGDRGVYNAEILVPQSADIILHSYCAPKLKDDTHFIFQGRNYRIVSYFEDKTYRDMYVTIELINE